MFDIMLMICAAAGIEPPKDLPGHDLMPLLKGDPAPANWRQFVYGFTTGAAPAIFCLQHSVRDSRWKLISNPIPEKTNLSAKAYVEGYNTHFAGGTRADEIAAAPEKIRAAYQRFLEPPRYELYDLKNDPYEWNDLANDPAHADEKARMIQALEEWQDQPRDPFADPALLEEFAQRQGEKSDLSYRKDKKFRWPYLEKFPQFMKAKPLPVSK